MSFKGARRQFKQSVVPFFVAVLDTCAAIQTETKKKKTAETQAKKHNYKLNSRTLGSLVYIIYVSVLRKKKCPQSCDPPTKGVQVMCKRMS